MSPVSSSVTQSSLYMSSSPDPRPRLHASTGGRPPSTPHPTAMTLPSTPPRGSRELPEPTTPRPTIRRGTAGGTPYLAAQCLSPTQASSHARTPVHISQPIFAPVIPSPPSYYPAPLSLPLSHAQQPAPSTSGPMVSESMYQRWTPSQIPASQPQLSPGPSSSSSPPGQVLAASDTLCQVCLDRNWAKIEAEPFWVTSVRVCC